MPVDNGSIGYRRRRSTVRFIAKCFDKHGAIECVDVVMSALFFSHVDYLVISNFYATRELTCLISQYALCIRVKDLHCSGFMRPVVAATFDAPLFYTAFERFAAIQSITCSACSTEVETELRNLSQAKQITFTAN